MGQFEEIAGDLSSLSGSDVDSSDSEHAKGDPEETEKGISMMG